MTNQTQSRPFAGIKALLLNCSIKQSAAESHTQKLMNRVAGIMKAEGVAVTSLYALDHNIAFGMIKDGQESGMVDDWPMVQKKIMESNIFVLGTPIWLGTKSSVATLAIERMYAHSGELNDKGQYLYYGKTGGCVITGNEDGVKHCAMDILYALQHIGFTIPPQADCGWLGEVGPGPSYGDTQWQGKKLSTPAGFDSDFTNRNTTFMAWNLMHMAKLLQTNDGLPSTGNVTAEWNQVTNAADVNP